MTGESERIREQPVQIKTDQTADCRFWGWGRDKGLRMYGDLNLCKVKE